MLLSSSLVQLLLLAAYARADLCPGGWCHTTSEKMQDVALAAVEDESGGLSQWFREHRRGGAGARAAEKTNFFLPIYHRHLQRLKARGDVRFLELGVQSGGSQLMFLDYFGQSSHAYGADLEPKTQK